MEIVVIGIGQRLRGDDEAGLAAVSLWQERYPVTAGDPRVRVELAESPGVGLLNLLEGADAGILVDAVLNPGETGSLMLLDDSDLAAYSQGSGSAHGWGVAETLVLGYKVQPGSIPETLKIIAITAGQVGIGTGFSPGVSGALEAAAGLIQETVLSLIG